MGLFKSSGPPNWSLGSLLLFQQLFPIWVFICFLKKIFFFGCCVQEAIWKALGHDRPPPSLRKGDSPVPLAHAPLASCLHGAACGSAGAGPVSCREALWLSHPEALSELQVGTQSRRLNCPLPRVAE